MTGTSEKDRKDKFSIPNSIKIKDILQEKEEKFKGKDDIFGMTLLTNPGYISSSRNIMFTSHLRQFVNLNKPDFPKVFTNYENIVGKYSTGYYQAKSDMQIVDKIPRYEDGVHNNHLFFLFTYDPEKDYYDIIQKRIVEDLTEKFGFSYKTSEIDKKEVGKKIKKGEVLYKTTSYDDDMNYCYGKNVKFIYLLDTHTIEDAIVCSKSFAKSMCSKEVEVVKVSLNDNDIFCNLYGTSTEYKCFPDIGEFVKNKIICAKRRIHNNQVLYDLKNSNLKKINFMSDILFFIDGRVIDITIYSNKTLDEIEDNRFNQQIKKYLSFQKQFYKRVYDRCKEIIESGSKYSSEINFYYQKAKNILDDNYKWKEEDNSVFSNMVIEFLVERDVELSVGQKITGRYGNKGVISKILPDDQMPYLETGERVDVIFNTLGVINRLNSFQLYEQSINFICNRVVEKLSTIKDLSEKEKLLFRLIWHFNEKEEEKLKNYYKKLTKSKKEEFFKDIEQRGIYIHIPPLWEDKILYDRLKDIYKEFDWIKPYQVYVNKFGRKIKIMKDLIVGDMYIIKLKQTSKKGFLVRATGSLSKRGVPEKSNKAKTHQELYSRTPIRIGDQENINSVIGVDPSVVAQLHLFYRSSVIGRRDLGSNLATSIKELKDFKYSPEFKNRNVEILQAYLKAMGLKIVFSEDNYVIDIYTDDLEEYDYDDKIFICTKAEFEDIKRVLDVKKELAEEDCFVGTNEEYEAEVQRRVQDRILRENNYVIDINL